MLRATAECVCAHFLGPASGRRRPTLLDILEGPWEDLPAKKAVFSTTLFLPKKRKKAKQKVGQRQTTKHVIHRDRKN